MWASYLEWSTIAQRAIKDRKLLRQRLDYRSRRAGNVVDEEDSELDFLPEATDDEVAEEAV